MSETWRMERPEDLDAFARRVRRCSPRELEDLYYELSRLAHPGRYRIVLGEIDARHLRPAPEAPPRALPDLGARVAGAAWAARWPRGASALLGLAAFAGGFVATCIGVACLWVFAGPLGFDGVQPALAYAGCLPVALGLGASTGARLRGREGACLPAAAGAVAALALFGEAGGLQALFGVFLRAEGAGQGGFTF